MYNRDDSRNNNNRGGFGGNFQRQMYKATCSECGKETEVPFRPKEGLPVYCKECYMAKKGKTNTRRESNEEESF
jgi:CxxC-x17-CxxC domain-containing protein